MYFKRIYELDRLIKKGKVLLIYGPRRAGKTTLLTSFLEKSNLKYKFETGDNIRIQNLLGSLDMPSIKEFAEGYQLLAIDEAQYIPNIGKALKIIVDLFPDLMVTATGSSSFELADQAGEPLTGRKRTLLLYPLSQKEIYSEFNRYELKEKLEEFLIYGAYPETVSARTRAEKIEAVEELVDSYVFKDILAFDRLKSPRVLSDLLKLLAFQVGSLVSLNELATQLRIDVKTVTRYLDLLEKAFVIKKISGFSRNLRKEITSKAKYYFIDNGIRNGIIRQFNPLDLRGDRGALWENFFVMEWIKKTAFDRIMPASFHFWRTYDGAEIDLVTETDSRLTAYECKFSPGKTPRAPRAWAKNYPSAGFYVATTENYLDFLL